MSDKNSQLQEIQMIEQTLQNILLQKQAFQMEAAETESALAEVEKSHGEVFKIVGQLMIKTEKKAISDELASKQKLLNLRLNTFEKQEANLTQKLEQIREQFLKETKE